jgi:hypothetical protein
MGAITTCRYRHLALRRRDAQCRGAHPAPRPRRFLQPAPGQAACRRRAAVGASHWPADAVVLAHRRPLLWGWVAGVPADARWVVQPVPSSPPTKLTSSPSPTSLSILSPQPIRTPTPFPPPHNVDPQEEAGRGACRPPERRERRGRGVSCRLLDVIPLHHMVAKAPSCLHCGRLVLCFSIDVFVWRHRASLSPRGRLSARVSLPRDWWPSSDRCVYVLFSRLLRS